VEKWQVRRERKPERGRRKGRGNGAKPPQREEREKSEERLRKFGLEPIPFAPKANTLPLKLHPDKVKRGGEKEKRRTNTSRKCPKQELNLADFSFQENALTD
jgi:hypothetical protein